MKKCVFIIPYFGHLPDSFAVFLKTCAPNKDFDFLLFTDDDRTFEYPENVKRVVMTFEVLQELFRSKFDFEISLKRPYKLCDYKPAYGYVFEEYISDYAFWGHCDIDIILGDLGHFLTNELLDKYDKLFCLGHMIIYKNNYENNRAFMMEWHKRQLYKEYFSTEEITAFDETWGPNPSANDIFKEYGKKVFEEDWSLNFEMLPTAFTRVKYNAGTDSFDILPRKRTVYIWNNGKINQYYLKGGNLASNEEMYMHFQSRHRRFAGKVLSLDRFKIVPNRFMPINRDIVSKKSFYLESMPHLCLHYVELKWGRLKRRLLHRPLYG